LHIAGLAGVSSFFSPSSRRYSPDGEGASWWRRRLSKAIGTTSSDFVNASLFQIQPACRSLWGGISELAMNAALAVIEAEAPKTTLKVRSTSKWRKPKTR
jgi:hypothetical protein